MATQRRTYIMDACKVAEATGARQVIVLAFYGDGPLAGKVSGSSYGKTRRECDAVATVLDDIFDRITRGEIPGPR